MLAASAAIVAGCTSVGPTVADVEHMKPLVVADTTKSAEAYSTCLHESWTVSIPMAPGAQRFTRPDGFVVRTPQGDIAKVTGTSTGAHVEFIKLPVWISVLKPENDVKACL